MPLYDLAAVAHAVDLTPKQLDNLLSRNHLPRIEKKRRGVSRRFTPEVAMVVKLANDIGTALDLPPGKLLKQADEFERTGRHEVPVGEFVRLEIDLEALRASVSARLNEAVEVVGRRRRGRPSRSEHA